MTAAPACTTAKVAGGLSLRAHGLSTTAYTARRRLELQAALVAWFKRYRAEGRAP